jgi:hypothetical protein
MKYCCETFEECVNEREIELLNGRTFSENEKGFYVVGCCGNCYVTDALKFCPFCGEKLKEKENV